MKNRGSVVENLEHLFRQNTSVFKSKIQYDQLILQILEDPSINAHCSNVDSADMKVQEDSDNYKMIFGLYIRGCCHSYGKDIKEKENVKRKSIRKPSLRTEVKKCSIVKSM